jgi:Flp pilus assembly protein TadD
LPDHTPLWNNAVPDPAQLALGAFESAATLPPDAPPGDGSETVTVVADREPPVCGEWSFDLSDNAESRGGATFVDATTPTPARAAPTGAGVATPAAGPSGTSRTPPAPTRQRDVPLAPPAPPPPPRRMSTSGQHRLPAQPRSLTPPTPLPALEELRSIHDARPGDGRTAISLATALDKRGNIEGALTVLERAIAAGADAVTLRCARAVILAGRLRYDDAEAELKRAVKLRADDPEVLLQQGVLACRRAKWRDAVEPLTHVVKLNPHSGAAHFYLGEALNKLDRLADALDAYERAATLEPANWRALKGVGIVLDRMGRPADAATYYRRARDAQSG